MRAIITGAGRALAPVASLGCAAAILVLALLLAGRPLGIQAMVDRSDSMRPAIAAGDLVVSRIGSPAKVGPGDIVTFTDPERRGRLITHRIVERSRAGASWAFVTRGDANSGSERWKVEASGSVGRYVGRVPRAGYAVAWLSSPLARLGLLGLGGLVLGGLLLRRIWSA